MLTYRIFNAYFQYLKCLFTSFLMPTYNILKLYIGPVQLKMVFQRDRFLQEFVYFFSFFNLTKFKRAFSNNHFFYFIIFFLSFS